MQKHQKLFTVSPKVARASVGAGLLLAGAVAHADAGDGGAVAALTAAGATAVLVATAALAVVVGIKVFKYIRAAL
jgi:hypothetical protein